MTGLRHPFGFDAGGRSAREGPRAHLRQLVELLLLTSPGERVMRPDLGSGLRDMVFEPLDLGVGAAGEALLRASLQRWLGDRLDVESVRVDRGAAELRVTVTYRPRGEAELETLTVVTPGGGR